MALLTLLALESVVELMEMQAIVVIVMEVDLVQVGLIVQVMMGAMNLDVQV